MQEGTKGKGILPPPRRASSSSSLSRVIALAFVLTPPIQGGFALFLDLQAIAFDAMALRWMGWMWLKKPRLRNYEHMSDVRVLLW